MIRERAPAFLKVVEQEKAGLGGRPEKLVVRALRTSSVAGQEIALEGTYSVEGADREAEAWGGMALMCCAILIPGERAVMAAGTGWTALVERPVKVPRCQQPGPR